MTDDVVVGLVSRDPRIVADVRRLCAAAGRSLQVAATPADVPVLWRRATVVLVEVDAGRLVDEVGVGRRDRVVVLGDDVESTAGWRLAARVGADRVLSCRADEEAILGLLALAGEHTGPPGPMLGVVAGAGGAGASVLAAALACTAAAAGRDTTLVDLDQRGGGVDLLLGLERAPGLRWPDLRSARGVIRTGALSEALPRLGRLAVVSAGRTGGADPTTADCDVVPGEAVTAVVDAARRGGGIVVADLPRAVGDAAARAALIGCDRVLLTVPAEVRGVAAAASLAADLSAVCADVRVVCRLGTGRLRAPHVGMALGLPVAATLSPEPKIAAAADTGRLAQALRRSRLAATCHTLLGDLALVEPAA